MASVYGNGNCLNNKWDEDKMKQFLSDKSLFEAESYKGRVCYHTGKNGKKINPFHLIASGKYTGCTKALARFASRLNLGQIFKMIEEIPVLTDVQIKYYKEILKSRANHLIMLAGNLQNNRTKELNIFSINLGGSFTSWIYLLM